MDERLAAMFERLPIGVVLLDAELRVVTANDAFAGFAAGRPAELVGRPLAEILPALALTLGVAAATVRDTGNALTMLDIVAAPRRFVADLFPVPPGVGVTLRERPLEVSDTQPLLDRDAMFRVVFEHAAVGMIVVDWSGGGIRPNHAFLRMLGYTQEEVAHLGIQGVSHPDDFGADVAAFQRLIAGEIDHYQIVKRYLRKDGGVLWGRLFVSLVRDEHGAPVLLIAMIEDVTDRHRAEQDRERLIAELQQAVRAREVFLSIASHELRTPLTPLKLLLQHLRERDAEGRELATAVRLIDRLTALVETMLDVSRITTERMALHREQLDLGEVARDVIERHRVEAERNKSSIALTATERLPLLADRLRLEQVLTNLLANAIKFGAGSPIEVDVGLVDNTARLTVRDHGIGIAPEMHGRIFEVFERAVSETSFGGLGLGLFIAQQIVEAHDGRILVESKLGEGATFTIELPLGGKLIERDHELDDVGR